MPTLVTHTPHSSTRTRLSALIPKVPVKIDLTWLKGGSATLAADAEVNTPHAGGFADHSAKAQMIRQVMALNDKVSPEYLSEFSFEDLAAYRDRLAICEASGSDSRWVRMDNTPGISTWRPR